MIWIYRRGSCIFRKLRNWRNFLSVRRRASNKALRQINEAELGSLIVDYGVEGHLEHAALAYQVIQLSVERMKEEHINGKTSADTKFKRYRTALYELFGVPIEALSTPEIHRGIHALKEKLEKYENPDMLDAPLSWESFQERFATARE